MGLDTTEYEEMRELVREGLEVVRDASAERRALLVEWSEFADFVLEQTKRMQQEWQERRAALVAAGKLPSGRATEAGYDPGARGVSPSLMA